MKILFTTAIILFLPVSAIAADPAAGKSKTASCVACHGKEGISNAPNFPNLACQKDVYLVKQLKDFRDGKRKDPVMAGFAKGLSDADIKNIAAYYSQLPCGK